MMMDDEELPKWLRGKRGYDIWQRANLWMLFNAMGLRGKELTLDRAVGHG